MRVEPNTPQNSIENRTNSKSNLGRESVDARELIDSISSVYVGDIWVESEQSFILSLRRSFDYSVRRMSICLFVYLSDRISAGSENNV